jgi:ribosomal protein L7/L12
MEYIFGALALLIIVYLFSKIIHLENRMKNMQYTLYQLTQQAGIEEFPINNELRDLIEEGKEVQAVKRARETLGLSLIEGKRYVDALKAEKGLY